jgi:predicted amidophosphoribosyltransferase
MDIDFNCPRCNQPLSVEASGAGMLVNCPECKEQIEIPRGAVEGKEETANPNLMRCPDCGKEVSRNAESCPHCGRKLKEKQTATGLLAAIVIGLGIGFLLFGAAFCSH